MLSNQYLFDLKTKFISSHPKRNLTVHGKEWKYIASGSGNETLLFLHGGGSESMDWFRHILVFEQNYQIIAPDFLCANTIEDVLLAIESILKENGIEKVTIVSASLGSIIAQCFVRQYPEQTKDIVLSNCATTQPKLKILRFLPFIKYVYPYATSKLRRNYSKILNQIPMEFQSFYRNEFETQSIKSLDHLQAYTEFNLIRDFFSNYKLSPNDLSSWLGRVLIIESENDGTISKSMRDNLKRNYPNAQVKTFKDAEHASGITRFDEFNSVILNFIQV